MYYLLRFATIILPRIPTRFRAILAWIFGLCAYCVATGARKHAMQNMLHVLGPQTQETPTGRRRLRRKVRQMFQYNTRNYLELCALPGLQPKVLEHTIRMDGLEHLQEALELGKGVILISAHFGPFDYMVHYAVARGYDVTIPVEQLKDQRLLDLITGLRSSKGVQFIPLGNSTAMRAIMQKLKSNQIVLITGDRAIQGQSSEVSFFDAPARLPSGPAMLARRTGATVVAAFGWWMSPTRVYAQCIPITLDMPEEQRTNLDCIMHKISQAMEHYIKISPEQWIAFSPIWQTDSTQAARATQEQLQR